jgi:hypothetical protein
MMSPDDAAMQLPVAAHASRVSLIDSAAHR